MAHRTGKVIHSGLSKLERGEAWLQGARLASETQAQHRAVKNEEGTEVWDLKPWVVGSSHWTLNKVKSILSI